MELNSLGEKISFNRIHNEKGLKIYQIRCSICKYIVSLHGCTLCIRCSKIFCRECTNIEFCICGDRIIILDEEFYSNLGEIEITCKYIKKGCNDIILYKHLKMHQVNCKYSIDKSYCEKKLNIKDEQFLRELLVEKGMFILFIIFRFRNY